MIPAKSKRDFQMMTQRRAADWLEHLPPRAGAGPADDGREAGPLQTEPLQAGRLAGADEPWREYVKRVIEVLRSSGRDVPEWDGRGLPPITEADVLEAWRLIEQRERRGVA